MNYLYIFCLCKAYYTNYQELNHIVEIKKKTGREQREREGKKQREANPSFPACSLPIHVLFERLKKCLQIFTCYYILCITCRDISVSRSTRCFCGHNRCKLAPYSANFSSIETHASWSTPCFPVPEVYTFPPFFFSLFLSLSILYVVPSTWYLLDIIPCFALSALPVTAFSAH